MTEAQYRLQVKSALEGIYQEVATPWYPFQGHGRRIYSPAIDVAVGPFATRGRYGNWYTELLE